MAPFGPEHISYYLSGHCPGETGPPSGLTEFNGSGTAGENDTTDFRWAIE